MANGSQVCWTNYLLLQPLRPPSRLRLLPMHRPHHWHWHRNRNRQRSVSGWCFFLLSGATRRLSLCSFKVMLFRRHLFGMSLTHTHVYTIYIVWWMMIISYIYMWKKRLFFLFLFLYDAPFETLIAEFSQIDICQAHSIRNLAEKLIAARKSNKELVVREKSSF